MSLTADVYHRPYMERKILTTEEKAKRTRIRRAWITELNKKRFKFFTGEINREETAKRACTALDWVLENKATAIV